MTVQRTLAFASTIVSLVCFRAAPVPAQQVPAAEQGPFAVRELAATVGSTCAITNAGSLYCWGANVFHHSREPQRSDICGAVSCRTSPVLMLEGVRLVTVSATSIGFGMGTSGSVCVVLQDGRGQCWGEGSSGQLGVGGDPPAAGRLTEISEGPRDIAGGLTFSAISAGLGHACGLTTNGVAYCWGDNLLGQLGSAGRLGQPPVRQPVMVAGALRFGAIYAGSYMSCALTREGRAYCWGRNSSGRLGRGEGGNATEPVAVSGDLTFSGLSLGDSHVCGITTAGAAYCWGRGDEGQLGNGGNASSRAPSAVSGDLTFQSIAAGDRYSCGVTTAGAAYCWGKGVDGQLGIATPANQAAPVPVAGETVFERIAAGRNHTCAISRDGAVYCWGKGGWGNLGNGARTDSPTPVRVVMP